MKTISVVLFDGFTALDAFGPVEVFTDLKDCRIQYVSLEGGIITNRQSIRIETKAFSEIEEGGILLIPGGFGTRTEIRNERLMDALARAIEQSDYVLCVCTGSALAAGTGALDGRRATSNRRAFDWVMSCGPKVIWVKDARWVRDGKFYTSAGVSAGIDMAFAFVRDRYGEEKAGEIRSRMEYQGYGGAVRMQEETE